MTLYKKRREISSSQLEKPLKTPRNSWVTEERESRGKRRKQNKKTLSFYYTHKTLSPRRLEL